MEAVEPKPPEAVGVAELVPKENIGRAEEVVVKRLDEGAEEPKAEGEAEAAAGSEGGAVEEVSKSGSDECSVLESFAVKRKPKVRWVEGVGGSKVASAFRASAALPASNVEDGAP